MSSFKRSSLGNIAGFAACAGMMAYALYAQHFLDLAPCPLCVFQRVALIALGAVFFAAAIHPAGVMGRRVYALLLLLVASIGAAIAGRHVYLQNLPPEQVPACGPGLDFMLDTLPIAETLKTVFAGSGECATIDWMFLGLSMPAWTLIAFVGFAIFGVWANWTGADQSRYA